MVPQSRKRGDLGPENICFCKNFLSFTVQTHKGLDTKFGYKLTPFSDGIKSADSILCIKILV